ncbi:MAG: hypothetical protein NVS2B7_03900 [Herpetosiphon sp.]
MIDSLLEPEARRLVLAATLAGQARRKLGGRVPTAATGAVLAALARCLSEQFTAFERIHGLQFIPSYPGLTVGPEASGTGVRLVLACVARHADGTPLGVVVTTLIAGRFVQVSVAPAHTPIPAHWHPL